MTSRATQIFINLLLVSLASWPLRDREYRLAVLELVMMVVSRRPRHHLAR